MRSEFSAIHKLKQVITKANIENDNNSDEKLQLKHFVCVSDLCVA